ncbi:MAG TPA: amino acid adenylation domain-containing protein [Terriglobales bacterium]|nr:amino acid adenylation domain-containing protein [Terriglobales bacterium]
MNEIITGNSLRSECASAEIAVDRSASAELEGILSESRPAYWRRCLSGAPVLTFPTSRPRPAAPTGQFAAQPRQIRKNLVEGLRQISHNERIPFSLVLLAAFQVLLLRYTSQDDLVVGCMLEDMGTERDGIPASGRNAFPLRVDLSDDPTFRDLLARSYATTLEAIERGSSSLADWIEELTSELGVEAPTFQLSFSYELNNPRLERAAAQVPVESSIPDAPVDLHLAIDDDGEELSVRLLYAKELFDAADIDRTLHNLETLLQAVAQDSDQRVSTLPLLTEQEQRQIVVEWNQNIQDYPRDKCLHELLEDQAERASASPAVVQGKKQLTYREFNERANQLAHYLQSCGVGCGVTVGIRLDPTFDFAVALIAVLKSGGACLPLDPKYPQERLTYMLEDSQAQVLITQKGPGSEVPAGCRTLILSELADTLSAQPRTNTNSGATPNNIAYVLYTSGSTGKPRGVLLPHAGLVNYTTSAARMFGIGPSDRMMQFCSISFDIAIEEMYTTWLSGAALVLRTEEMSLAVPEFLAWVERQKITILDLPTAYWHEWVHHFSELKQPVPPSVRLVIVGGEKASAKSLAAWSKSVRGRVRWINTYGPTEASICVTAFEPNFASEDAIPENIPVGRPLPNCRVYLLDRQLNPVPVGVPGELHVGGVCVSQGYHNRPELTAQKFIADPFSKEPGARMYKTGDMARYLPSGDIEFLGRGDDQVKIRGFRVELGEIEAALAKHPKVAEVAVVAREDVPGDKRLIAYVVPARNAQPTPTELRHYLQQHLPDYMVPSDCVLLDAMPLTPNGKVDRRGLPAPQNAAPSPETVAASDAFQSQLVGVWEEVLGRKPIGIRDNFFELGGHSLLAARLMHRIGRTMNKTVPLALLFEAPTIEQLAATLRADGWSRHWSSLVPIQPAGSHTPFFCIHGVGGNVVGFHELGRRMAPDFPFYGLQSQGLDGKHPCHTTIEEMASHYLDEIRGVQPRGPYFLGGFSFGGLVAYEMSQQLLARGEEAGLLVLFDTYPGDLKSVAESLVHLLLTPSWRNWTYDLPKALRKRINRLSKNWNLPQHLKDVRDTNRAASDRYVLRAFAGKATLIRADEQSLRSSSEDPHAAWNSLVSNLEVHSIPGNHYDILVEPQVEHLAECLKACISEASFSRVS